MPVEVFVAFAVVLVPVLGFAGWLVFSWRRYRAYHLHKGAELPDLPLRELLRYALGEVLAMGTLAWWHLTAGRRDGLRYPKGPVTGPPVLCVHGLTQNGSNLWGIRRALERRGRATRAVSLGVWGRTLEAYVPPLVHGLRELVAAAPDGRIDVVAHSMGGVILRMALADHPELCPNVRRVVTIASPHAGTAGGRGLPLGKAARLLGRRSTLLRDLPGFPTSATLTTIAARHDLVVYPQSTCFLDGAAPIAVPDVGHAGLLTRAAAIAQVVDAVCEGDAADPGEDAPRTA